MLLETLDIRKNDILVYSQNKFDFEENFKIIFKNERFKRVRPVSYFDVCEIIKQPAPKNMILYRLLTNVTDMDAYSTKYGYFLKIDGKMELMYFDPVFALKDLRHLRFSLDPDKFRFKIQHVGLRSLDIKDNEINFEEVYSFDLRAEEATNLNDKIYADAIFVFDDTYNSGDPEEDEFDRRIKELMRAKSPELSPNSTGLSIEQTAGLDSDIGKPNIINENDAYKMREKKVDLLKQAMGISDSGEKDDFASFLESNRPHNPDSAASKRKDDLLELFKTSGKNKKPNFERESVILKISKDK